MKTLRRALLVLFGAGVVYIFLPRRLFYRRGRPTRAGRLVNRFWAWAYGTGLLPPQLVCLEVPGRRTGRTSRTALVACRYLGQRYLVSMLGERSAWVRNVRAAGGNVAIHHGRRDSVRLVEVPPEERAPVLKAYLRVAPGARAHIPVPFDAPLEAFQAVAARYPVFRIERPVEPVVPVVA